MYTIAIVGFDEFTESYLVDRFNDIRFIPALSRDETIIGPQPYPFEECLDLAERRARDAGAAGVITFWDFPSALIAPFVAKRCGFRYASVDSVMRCAHKYWFRLEQAAVMDTPTFCAFDPFSPNPMREIDLRFPFWVKPVIGHSSMLGFHIGDQDDFDAALSEIRSEIGTLTEPFAYPLAHCNLPDDLRRRGPNLCIAEELISRGDQYTIEGWVNEGELRVYGIVESVREPNGHSFARYQYPANLDARTAARLTDVARQLIERIGYDNCPFNMEFFHEPDRGHLHVLEINSRLSQSHSDLFLKVDGLPHQRIAIDLALGNTPTWSGGEGEYDIAAKHMVRRRDDGVVTHVPSASQIAQVEKEVPGVRVELTVAPGQRLSDLPEQESYSYELADLFIGARNEDELVSKYEHVVEKLSFEFA